MTKVHNEEETTAPAPTTPPADEPQQDADKPVSPWGVGHHVN